MTEPRRLPQVDEIDAPLRNSLWNWILTLITSPGAGLAWVEITKLVAVRFLKVPLDDVPRLNFENARDWLRSQYEALPWFEVYNLIEFLVGNVGPSRLLPRLDKDALAFQLNMILQEEFSAYRFIEEHLAPISTPSEIAAIEEALSAARTKGLEGVATHIDTALSLLGQKPKPDYRNSVKESISAVESAARQIAGEGATLKDALAALEKKGVELHGVGSGNSGRGIPEILARLSSP